MLHSTCFFSLFLSLTLHLSGTNSAKMTLINQCNYTVWPALSSSDNVNLSTTGFVLPSGQNSSVNVPVNWNGRIWGRTLCTTDKITGNFSCFTGDCNSGKIACDGGGSAPNTLVEFDLDSKNGLDFYDVSLVEGFNMPVIVVPVSDSGSNCESTGCVKDLNAVCPTELNLTRHEEVVACQDPCSVFRTEEYCCVGNRSSCEPTTLSNFFKTECPQAYSYRKDDTTSTFTCSTPADYNIVFCPKSTNASRRVGDSLIAGNETSKWLSPSGVFAFGFYQLPNKLFLLAIWYNQIQNTTIIWSANGDNLAPIGSKLELNDSRGLVLKTPQGVDLWTPSFTSGTIFNGLMNDDGNFQLLDQNSVSLWDSFAHPTDTLLPTQVLELGGELSSRQGEFNFSTGRFKLQLQEDGNLVLKLVNLDKPYFHTGTADEKNKTNVGIKFVFDKSSFLYVLKKSGEKFEVSPSNEKISSNDVYYKATINYDGVLTVSYHPKDPKKEQRWVTSTAKPENICLDSTFKDVGGVCGFDSTCNLKDDMRPMCNCPERYSLIDSNNMYGGCILTPFQEKKVNKDHETLIIVISVLLGFLVLVILVLVGAMYFGFSFNRKKIKSGRTNNGVVEKNLRNFTFMELVEATGNFSEELGRGSFSIVYKGTIDMTSLAVKKLDKLFRDNDKEFQTEMNVIGQTHHRNLVRLLGYCNEGQHRILVYEFMSNGTLASFLFTPLKANWRQRFEIASGIARGLVYLHEECCTQIIHCDIKPQNILLDDQYNARISDFGLAKLLLINQSHTETGIRGTKGYVAPDWFRSSPITPKVDTYSFGVMLLEIICCRRNVENEFVDEEKGILTDWAYDCFKTRRLDILLENDDEALKNIKSFEKFVMIALWCIHEDPSLRPTMKKVLLMLEGIVDVSIPPNPYLYGSAS